jgi:hypothetical protein
LLALIFLNSCASLTSTSPKRVDEQIAQADKAYRTLDGDHVTAYNNAVAAIAREINGKTPAELRSELDSVQVRVDQSKIQLPLARYRLAPRSPIPNESADVGVPMLLDYDTSSAPLYPPDGLTCSATAIYRRVNGERHLSLITTQNTITLNGSVFALNRAHHSDVKARWIRCAQRLSKHAFARFDARADRNFSDGALRSEQGNRVAGAGSAINAVRVRRFNESDAARPGGERALSGLDILVRHRHAGVV